MPVRVIALPGVSPIIADMYQPVSMLRLQRSEGEARVGLADRRGRARVAALHQAGCAKALLPRVEGSEPEVVFLNTAGGLTGGDRLALALALGPGIRAVGTTQTAERAYAAGGGTATVRVALRVGPGARLDWLPQETILFEDAALDRSTTIDLEGDAACLFVETVVLGRAAMGETVGRAALRDRRIVLRNGRPVLVEPLALASDVLASSAEPALLRGARALATLALVAPGAEDAVAAVRRLLDEPGVEGAASGWGGKCVVRLFGNDGWPVRRQLVRLLAALRGRPLPRVWQM